jgi:SAM-dependent methyltransferase
MITKLNLGCGEFPKKGYLNVDVNSRIKPDMVLDLNNPATYKKLKSNFFTEVTCEHVLEHLEKPFEVMKELHRILKKNGKLIIQVPHFSRGFTHSEHEHGFDVGFPLYFDPKFKGGYMGYEFKLEKMRLDWMIRFDLKKGIIPGWSFFFLKILNAVFTFLANIQPYFCSRFWCYYVGGFEQIEYTFRK